MRWRFKHLAALSINKKGQCHDNCLWVQAFVGLIRCVSWILYSALRSNMWTKWTKLLCETTHRPANFANNSRDTVPGSVRVRQHFGCYITGPTLQFVNNPAELAEQKIDNKLWRLLRSMISRSIFYPTYSHQQDCMYISNTVFWQTFVFLPTFQIRI